MYLQQPYMLNKAYFGILVGKFPLDSRLNMCRNEPSFAHLPTYTLINRHGGSIRRYDIPLSFLYPQ